MNTSICLLTLSLVAIAVFSKSSLTNLLPTVEAFIELPPVRVKSYSQGISSKIIATSEYLA